MHICGQIFTHSDLRYLWIIAGVLFVLILLMAGIISYTLPAGECLEDAAFPSELPQTVGVEICRVWNSF